MKSLFAFLIIAPSIAWGFITCCPSPIFIDEFKVRDATIEEAFEAVRVKTRLLDTIESDPAKRGVNIILQGLTAEQKSRKVSLELRNVPLTYLLENICQLSRLRMRIDSYAIVVMSEDDYNSAMQTRLYKVPPDFLNSGAKK